MSRGRGRENGVRGRRVARQRQRSLFEEPKTEAPPPRLYSEVVFNRPLRTSFTYAVPRELEPKIQVGKRVLAPFGRGNHRTTAYCVGLADTAPCGREIKHLAAVLDETPLLSPALLELTRWIADYYFCGLGQVLDGVLPAAVKQKHGGRWAILYSPRAPEAVPPPELTVKQRRALESLEKIGRPATIQEICEAARCGQGCIKELRTKGYVAIDRKWILSDPKHPPPVVMDRPLALHPDQARALEAIVRAIDDSRPATFLIHGVTGSGKTEVYLQAIERVRRVGKQAIVLVPEISLTPQTIDRFRRRFGDVAVLHSQLTDVERNHHWRRIAAGEVAVAIGARSAVFAPFPALGLIVLDEEHETTFKQESTPRYHAREVAIERGRLEGAAVVLGSATPSLESYADARRGRFELLELPRRVGGAPMPRVELVDLRDEFAQRRRISVLGRRLRQAMQDALDAGGQVMLLLNRRGFSTVVLCPECGEPVRCQHCDIALTFHKELDRLVCHSCDADFPAPDQCPRCAAASIRYSGVGTERVEEEVNACFPDRVCRRMDSDTMRSAAHYDAVLADFKNGAIDVLIGTQMIAKGLDFPNVRLVGVISADTARNLPDFRASERTFQLLAQVAGRTGRGKDPGLVVVQTFAPDDPSVLAAAAHDFRRFVKDEIPHRRDFRNPPFTRLTRIIVRAASAASARAGADLLAQRLHQAIAGFPGAEILGPAPAPIARLKNLHRVHLLIRTELDADRKGLLAAALDDFTLSEGAEWAGDVDPINIL